MASSPPNGYRSASALAVCVMLFSVALMLTRISEILSLCSQIQLLDAAQLGAAIPPTQAELQDTRLHVLAGLELAFGIVVLLTLMLWVHRANRNARALGAEGMTYTPGWSLGWFFVPVANLFMPYRVLREIWKASAPGAATQWQQAHVSPVLAVWWGLEMVSMIANSSSWPILIGKSWTQLSGLESHQFNNLWEFSVELLIVQVIRIAACVLTIVVVVRITNLQAQRHVEQSKAEPEAAEVD